METVVAKTAGFCFGVNRAVEMAYKLLDEGKQVTMYGPIIHNPQVIEDMKKRGADIVEDCSQVKKDRTLLIRAHGVEKQTEEKIKQIGCEYCDATCPFVQKIHKIVSENSAENVLTLIAGDAAHPEVRGIRSYAKGESVVFKTSAELEKIFRERPEIKKNPVIFVAQTTFSIKDWKKCKKNINLVCTNAKIFDTICFATEERQSEAVTLSLSCDAMLIIGGRQSSNTAKLKTVCEQNAPTFLVESAEELESIDFSPYRKIGITAGASTPASTIKEVNDYVRKA